MTKRLMPLHGRIGVLLRSRQRPLLILAIFAMATLALAWRSGDFIGTIARLVVVVGVPVALTSLGNDLRRGVAPLWVQKPIDPALFFFARFVEGAVCSVVLSVLWLCVTNAIALWAGWELPTPPARMLVIGMLLSFVIASVGFGFSATLARGGRMATLALFGITIALEFMVLLDPSTANQPWFPVARVVLLPWVPLVELSVDGIEPASLLLALAWILGYAAVWIGIGTLGIRRAFTVGSWARSI